MAGGIVVSLIVQSEDRVVAALAALQDAMKDFQPFWRDVFAPKYFAMVQDVFALEGTRRGARGRFVAGGHWKPLTPRYKAWKEKHYPGRTILVREGKLRESLEWKGNGLGVGGVWEPQPLSVVFGTSVPYAAPNQATRPFLDPPDAAVFGPLLKAWILRNRKP
jgi:hypothetical protein